MAGECTRIGEPHRARRGLLIGATGQRCRCARLAPPVRDAATARLTHGLAGRRFGPRDADQRYRKRSPSESAGACEVGQKESGPPVETEDSIVSLSDREICY